MIRANKAQRTAQRFLRLTKSLGKLPPKAVANYVRTVIYPTFAYGSEAWYWGAKGLTRP